MECHRRFSPLDTSVTNKSLRNSPRISLTYHHWLSWGHEVYYTILITSVLVIREIIIRHSWDLCMSSNLVRSSLPLIVEPLCPSDQSSVVYISRNLGSVLCSQKCLIVSSSGSEVLSMYAIINCEMLLVVEIIKLCCREYVRNVTICF